MPDLGEAEEVGQGLPVRQADAVLSSSNVVLWWGGLF